MICAECCTKLNETHKFHEQCLRSKNLFMDYISKLRSVSETCGVLSVCLQDYKQNERNYYSIDYLFNLLNSNYIVTAGDDCYEKNHSVKRKTNKTGNQAGNVTVWNNFLVIFNSFIFISERNDTSETDCETHIDHMSSNTIKGSVNIKDKIAVKTEPEDATEYEVKTELNNTTRRNMGTFNIFRFFLQFCIVLFILVYM